MSNEKINLNMSLSFQDDNGSDFKVVLDGDKIILTIGTYEGGFWSGDRNYSQITLPIEASSIETIYNFIKNYR